MELLYNILMFYWDNRFDILGILVALTIGYGIGNGGITLFEYEE